MASSRKSSRNRAPADDLAARVAATLGKLAGPSRRLVVGLSGGVDSVVLLDCLQRAARGRRFRLSALHVNHQLSPNAGRWAAFCRRLCGARGIPFESVRVEVGRGAGVEAAARAARYAVFARQPCDHVVLAHHCDDQVETLLLQLLRGAGVRGLAGMPLLRGQARGERGEAPRQGRAGRGTSPPASRLPPPILRPLLDTTRAEILHYAKKRGLQWIEDESNRDPRFRRNFLRHEILPAIERRFPAYRVTIARSARHLAEASRLLDEVAASDGGAGLAGETLAVEALRSLPPARARNLLRYFLAQCGVDPPATARLGEALRQAVTAKLDARVSVDVGGAHIMRYAGRLHVVRAGGSSPRRYARRWRGETRLVLPDAGGVLSVVGTRGAGISRGRLRGGVVTVRSRAGGERLQPDCGRPRRSLKNLLQEAGIAPWLRERLPLVFHGKTLVWVPGIGIDCSYQAHGTEPAWMPDWLPSG